MKRGRRGKEAPGTVRSWIGLLGEIKNRFEEGDAERKKTALSALSRRPILDPSLLFRYHECILFLRAYPDDEKVFRLARRECMRFAERVELLRKEKPEAADRLADTGIAGTDLYYSFDHVGVDSLVRMYGDDLSIEWDESHTERFDRLLPLLACWAENDGLDLSDLSSPEWIDLRKGGVSRSDLRWLLDTLRSRALPPAVRRHLYDSMDVMVRWRLRRRGASRTNAEVPSSPVYFHRGPLLRGKEGFLAEVRRRLPSIDPAPPAVARRMIRTARTALAVRHRALYPIDHASTKEVLIAECGRGYRLVLFGMNPLDRLPLESDYGALIVKDGVPIGYGVGAILFDQVEIAVNIFDSWRQGESAHIFSQYVRVFHSLFGCRRFKIERYQVGHENDEGLQSGSFWFYYKLGFRPVHREVRALAAREAAKLRKKRGYRTPLAVLEKLARSDLTCGLDQGSAGAKRDFPLADLSLQVTEMIGRRFGGDGRKAVRTCAAEVARALGSPRWERWPAAEREWFRRLSLTLSLVPDLESWPAADKKMITSIIRSKGRAEEREFVRLLLRSGRLRRALEKAAIRKEA